MIVSHQELPVITLHIFKVVQIYTSVDISVLNEQDELQTVWVRLSEWVQFQFLSSNYCKSIF